MFSAQATLQMLDNQTLWTTATHCQGVLRAAGISHAIVGGVAVCLHGYRRNTIDLDLLIAQEDQAKVKEALTSEGFEWSVERAEFLAPAGTPVQFLVSGERAGKGAEVVLPEPASPGVTVEIEGLSVIALAQLIEMKLACGLSSPRRTHRDLADVVELIAVHQLSRSFARHLHKSVRARFPRVG